MITVGLDFGTHQTKVCIENKEGVELSYKFMEFKDVYGNMNYTFPSVIGINNNGMLSYGYQPNNFKGRVVKYFKQRTFCTSSPNENMTQLDAMRYSIWYLAYIIFDLEDVYGQDFSIQMGVPTDSSHVHISKQIATRIIASAYKLVEEVFENDKKLFLDCDIETLAEVTDIVPYSLETKEEYQLRIFPEAYACLKPLINQRKIAIGMNLMIDIGGGTTDISFFTIEKEKPQLYDFFSINKGLNYLTCADDKIDEGINPNIKDDSEIDSTRRSVFISDINNICNIIRDKLLNEFKIQTSLNKERLFNALKNRPLVYCGGGSTFKSLQVNYGGYIDKKQISHNEWNTKSIIDLETIVQLGLCPILSTAYGLAISTENDKIEMKPLSDIFKEIRGAEEEQNQQSTSYSKFGKAYGGFSYADDWDAWK